MSPSSSPQLNQSNGAEKHQEATSITPLEPQPRWRQAVAILTYTPKRLRYDPARPAKYSQSLNIIFGLAAMITVANLYYTHPILNILARDFHVSDEASANIPTLSQAGYATGLLFVAPLGDLVRRRPFVLGLMLLTATVWIGLCITNSFSAFLALTYVTSIMSVTPQLMLPLVADLAPIERRATAVSIVTSGLLLGLLFARVMSGIVANFISWRYVYWIAMGLQYVVIIVLWFTLPDFPRTNKGINYFKILWSIVTITYQSPVLVQSCLIGFFTAAPFPAYWTTLTFLLSSPPYNYTPVVIGLFALIGIATMTIGPVVSRFVIDRYVPHFSVILGQLVSLTGVIIGTYTGTFTVAGPIIQAVMLDAGFQISQIANRSAIYAINPKARNRINTAFMVSIFCGQIMGTAVANHLYAQGGWVLSGSANVGFVGASLLIAALRGPWETGWLGWRGGWGLRRRDIPAKQQQQQEGQDEERAEESNGGSGDVTAAHSSDEAEHGEKVVETKDEIRSPLAENEEVQGKQEQVRDYETGQPA